MNSNWKQPFNHSHDATSIELNDCIWYLQQYPVNSIGMSINVVVLTHILNPVTRQRSNKCTSLSAANVEASYFGMRWSIAAYSYMAALPGL
jgi:hypothetical protein